MKRRIVMFIGMAALLTVPAAMGQADLSKEPGYVDLDAMESTFGEEPFLFVSVKGVLLNLVAEASSIEDPELADLLRKLKAVEVRGFKMGEVDARAMRTEASRFARELQKRGWEQAVRVRDEDEQVDLLLRSDGKTIAGLVVVVASDDDETVFVNIVGEIDPSQLARLGRKFDIDELERDW